MSETELATLVRPACRRCGKPLLLVPDLDEPGHWTLDCPGGWSPVMGQTDEQFRATWNDLPGDEVVRLERAIREMQR